MEKRKDKKSKSLKNNFTDTGGLLLKTLRCVKGSSGGAMETLYLLTDT